MIENDKQLSITQEHLKNFLGAVSKLKNEPSTFKNQVQLSTLLSQIEIFEEEINDYGRKQIRHKV